jgi:flagellar hook-length control protein FliK
MEQMSNILLGSSAKMGKSASAELSPSKLPSSSGSDAFLSALNQVSNLDNEGFTQRQYDSGNHAVEVSAAFSSAQSDIISEDEPAVDLELILAQIDLTGVSHTYDQSKASVGNDLPPELITGTEEIEDGIEIEDTIEIEDSIEIEDCIEIDAEVPADNFLSQLSNDEQLALAVFAQQDVASLTLLSAEELVALVESYNTAAAINSIDSISLPQNILAGLQETANAAVNASSTEGESIETENDEFAAQMIPKDKLQVGVLPKDKLHILGNEKSSGVTDAKLSAAELAKIETAKVDGAQLDMAKPELAKAELNVTLDTQMARKFELSQGASAAMAVAELDGNSADNRVDNNASLKALQNQSSFTPAHKSEVPQFQLSLRQGSEGAIQMQEMIKKFSPVMQQQLVTMVSKGIQQAEIRLDPPELGHMLVKINVQGDQTQVQFQVVHAQTKDLIEQALPKLRDLLAQEGMQLTDSQVSQGDGGRGEKGQQQSGGAYEHEQLDDNAAQDANLMANRTSHSNSAIDYYA